jgi:prepilin-type N-terminal cleavage/methylation domain-containing protein
MRNGQAGFTLMEVVVAAAVLSLSIVAVLSATTLGFGSVNAGRQSSTALFLAEARMEQVRAFVVSTTPGQGLANLTAAAFPDEAYSTIAGYPQYRRTVTINNATGIANTAFVQVRVFYRASGPAGLGPETSVMATTLLALR